jgi:hypothetical protein
MLLDPFIPYDLPRSAPIPSVCQGLIGGDDPNLVQNLAGTLRYETMCENISSCYTRSWRSSQTKLPRYPGKEIHQQNEDTLYRAHDPDML